MPLLFQPGVVVESLGWELNPAAMCESLGLPEPHCSQLYKGDDNRSPLISCDVRTVSGMWFTITKWE